MQKTAATKKYDVEIAICLMVNRRSLVMISVFFLSNASVEAV